jgi:hypothetical protein
VPLCRSSCGQLPVPQAGGGGCCKAARQVASPRTWPLLAMHVVSGLHGQTCYRSPTPAAAASRQVKSLIRPSTDAIMHSDVSQDLFKPFMTASQWINGCVASARQRRLASLEQLCPTCLSCQTDGICLKS